MFKPGTNVLHSHVRFSSHRTATTKSNGMCVVLSALSFCLYAAEQAICLYQNIFSFACKMELELRCTNMNLWKQVSSPPSLSFQWMVHEVFKKMKTSEPHQQSIMTISNHLLFHSLRETGALTFCLIPFTPTQDWRNVRLCYSNASFDFNFWCLVLWTTAFTNKINVRNLQHDMFGWKLRTKIPCCCNLRQKFRNEQTALILLQLST